MRHWVATCATAGLVPLTLDVRLEIVPNTAAFGVTHALTPVTGYFQVNNIFVGPDSEHSFQTWKGVRLNPQPNQPGILASSIWNSLLNFRELMLSHQTGLLLFTLANEVL